MKVVEMTDPSRQVEIREKAKEDLEGLLEGGQLAGFAMLVWDRDGSLGTSVRCFYGPIGRTMVAAFAHDAILKHVTIDATKEDIKGGV